MRDNVRVVLCQPRNPLNIGAAARAISNFGCSVLRLVDPFDLAFREAVSAVGGAPVLRAAEVFGTVAEAVADCSLVVGTTAVGHRELQHPIQRLEAAGPVLRAAASSAPVAILFGSEKFGLTNDEMSHCHWLMRIPTSDQTPSMNLGQAVAVCLYEIVRESSVAMRVPVHKAVRAADSEQMTQMLLAVLDESGYTNRIVATSTERKVRRFLRRVNFAARDAPLILGILRQILWKFRAERTEPAE
ncbi:MAG: tRNA/rRNA methyltransferase (SpoU) [Bryobacterales bacterium]|nr:tRNA/rRNA methyltransferase (SpoU) [Bryobacterales bacterium]